MGLPSDRPTVLPTFDVAEFARESDSKVSVGAVVPTPQEPTSEVRLVGRAPDGGTWEEEWARSAIGEIYVALEGERLLNLPLDHRSGFLLSRIDGSFDLETLVEISGMERGEALRLARELYELGVIDFR